MNIEPETEQPRHVSAVVLNYNSAAHLKICIERLRQQDYPSLSIIIVDNASAPDCITEIEDWLEKQDFDVLVGDKGRNQFRWPVDPQFHSPPQGRRKNRRADDLWLSTSPALSEL